MKQITRKVIPTIGLIGTVTALLIQMTIIALYFTGNESIILNNIKL